MVARIQGSQKGLPDGRVYSEGGDFGGSCILIACELALFNLDGIFPPCRQSKVDSGDGG